MTTTRTASRLTVTLPDGSTASRKTDHDYRYVVAFHQSTDLVRDDEGHRIEWAEAAIQRVESRRDQFSAESIERSLKRERREIARSNAAIAEAEARGGRWIVRSWHSRMDLAQGKVTGSARIFPVDPAN